MAFSLIWLPEILKNAGLKVALTNDWEDRGRGEMGTVAGVMCHHTGGKGKGNMSSLDTLINGRPDLNGPLAQLGLGRDGTYYIVAAGRCNHAGEGVWKGIVNGNASFIGIEAQNTGGADDFPWPEVQLDAYRRGVAAILNHIGSDAGMCVGHKEFRLPRGEKKDPSFDMVSFRSMVDDIIKGRTPAPALIPNREPGGKQRQTLRRGMKGEAVKQLQRLLRLTEDGDFGGKTEAAVRIFQRSSSLVPDGIVGPKTWRLLDEVS